MKIDYCLISSDLNQNYCDLYNYTKIAWGKMGIKTKLILIADSIPPSLENNKEDIILFKPITGVHTAFISQVIRLFYPCLFENKNILISDADIIPLSKEYFMNNIKKYDDSNFILYRDSYVKDKMFAMCYAVANSNIWKEIFKIENTDDITNKIIEIYDKNYTGSKNCVGWFTDQKLLYEYAYNYEKIIILKDSETKFKRLDKRQKKYIIDNLENVYSDIINKKYTDFHVIRPFHKYKQIINKIINLIT